MVCEKCNDTGHINGVENTLTGEILRVELHRTVNVVTGEIVDYGNRLLTPGETARLFRYPTWTQIGQRCPCQANVLAEQQIQGLRSAIPADVRRFSSLADYANAGYANLSNAQQAIGAASAVLEGYEINIGGVERPGMLLSGGTGTGKSSLAYVIYSHFLRQGVSCAWLDYRDLVNSIRESYGDMYRGQPLAGICRPFSAATVLIFDEIGSKTRDTVMFEDLLEAMRLIFQPRWAERKVTIGTTNLSAGRLQDQLGELAYSRIRGNCHVIELDGVDMRVGV